MRFHVGKVLTFIMIILQIVIYVRMIFLDEIDNIFLIVEFIVFGILLLLWAIGLRNDWYINIYLT